MPTPVRKTKEAGNASVLPNVLLTVFITGALICGNSAYTAIIDVAKGLSAVPEISDLGSEAEQWMIANPSEIPSLTSGEITYSDLARKVSKTNELDSKKLSNNKIQYFQDSSGNYNLCVLPEDPKGEFYVHEISTDKVSSKDDCSIDN